MSRMIIDPEYLVRISTELKNDKDFLSSAKTYLSKGIQLDQRVKNKIGNINLNDLITSIDYLIRSNDTIYTAVDKAVNKFTPLSDYKSSVKLEEFVSTVNYVQPISNNDLLDGVKDLESLKLKIDEYGKMVDSYIDPNSFFILPNGELINSLLLKNNFNFF